MDGWTWKSRHHHWSLWACLTVSTIESFLKVKICTNYARFLPKSCSKYLNRWTVPPTLSPDINICMESMNGFCSSLGKVPVITCAFCTCVFAHVFSCFFYRHWIRTIILNIQWIVCIVIVKYLQGHCYLSLAKTRLVVVVVAVVKQVRKLRKKSEKENSMWKRKQHCFKDAQIFQPFICLSLEFLIPSF